jgi:protein tyrosine/serine phosphatase
MARLILILLLPVMLPARPHADTPAKRDIPRFLVVADGLYRGGQPTEEGFEFLKQLGIKTVINLRMEYNEAEIVQKYGMNYVSLPIDEVRLWSQIPPATIAKYFEVLNNPANYPIFFHCRRGADRTGAMAAFYRIAIQGWDVQKAYFEARNIGMRWWYAGLRAQLYYFHPPERDKLQTAMEAR